MKAMCRLIGILLLTTAAQAQAGSTFVRVTSFGQVFRKLIEIHQSGPYVSKTPLYKTPSYATDKYVVASLISIRGLQGCPWSFSGARINDGALYEEGGYTFSYPKEGKDSEGSYVQLSARDNVNIQYFRLYFSTMLPYAQCSPVVDFGYVK